MNYRQVDEAVKAVAATSGVSVDLDLAPTATMPYAVIYPINTGDDETALASDSLRDCLYQITIVGQTREQSRWAQTNIEARMLDDASWSAYGFVTGVTMTSAGPVQREQEDLFSIVETYRVKVSGT